MQYLYIPTDITQAVEPVTQPEGQSNLAFMYEKIECDTVTVVTTSLGGYAFDLWVDDNGLLTNDPKPNYRATLLAPEGVMLFGHVLVAQSNGAGETVGVSDSEARLITEILANLCMNAMISVAARA